MQYGVLNARYEAREFEWRIGFTTLEFPPLAMFAFRLSHWNGTRHSGVPQCIKTPSALAAVAANNG